MEKVLLLGVVLETQRLFFFFPGELKCASFFRRRNVECQGVRINPV